MGWVCIRDRELIAHSVAPVPFWPPVAEPIISNIFGVACRQTDSPRDECAPNVEAVCTWIVRERSCAVVQVDVFGTIEDADQQIEIAVAVDIGHRQVVAVGEARSADDGRGAD